ncbi:hypothetical protein QYE76_028956 [Lolium multiflorum]|uniref:Transposase MuDR plant domain-containing protein n=1 Tax=Lolium multiflorum TaxID=4521 RepID=A0AAD8VHT8_LOLMU|nr:hypothetical protein QYE76_028956 [Lolium multiflorum]
MHHRRNYFAEITLACRACKHGVAIVCATPSGSARQACQRGLAGPGMARIVHVHHVDKDSFLKGNIDPDPDEVDLVFERSPNYEEVLEQVRIDLNWMDPSYVVELEGRHNAGFGMHVHWKTMGINSEQRWVAYKEVVAESLDKALELFATKKVDTALHLDLNRLASPLNGTSHQPLNQEEISEPRYNHEANDEEEEDGNEVELHENNVGDLDKYYIQENMDRELPYSRCYASDSDDDGPDEEIDEEGFTAKEAEAHEKVLGRDHRVPLFRDLSLADEAIVDGGMGVVLGPRPISHRDDNHAMNGIASGIKFSTLLELKHWLKEYSVKHHRPYKVVHSDVKQRYTVKCEEDGCPWVVRARPLKGGPDWHISSCVSTHMCRGMRMDGKDAKHEHRQLKSEFIAYRLSNSISSLPTMSIKSVQELLQAIFNYEVKYGKAWKAKQAAFKMLYGDWEEAYNRLPRLLGAMAAANPGMVHVVEPYGNKTRIYNGKKVLKGVRALPVTAIVRYTFDKMNTYFLKYSDETDMQIAGTFKKNKHKYKYPPKIDEWMEFQSRKADSQVATLFDNDELIYQVDEPGGTTVDTSVGNPKRKV